MRRNRTQSKPEIAQGVERAYAGLLFEAQQEAAKIGEAEARLRALPGEIRKMKRREKELRSQMQTLAETIRRFEPSWAPSDVEPKRIRQSQSPFAKGEVGRHCVNLLRRTGLVLGADEMLADLCRLRGVEDSRDLRIRLYGTVRLAMTLATERGMVTKVEGKPAKWKVTTKAERERAGSDIHHVNRQPDLKVGYSVGEFLWPRFARVRMPLR